MPRPSNQQLRDMPLVKLKEFALEHPAEARRVANQCAIVAGECYGVSVKYSASQVVEKALGKHQTVLE